MGSSRCGEDGHDGWEEAAMLEQSYVGQTHPRMQVHAPGDRKWNCPQEARQMVLHAAGWVRNENQGPGPSRAQPGGSSTFQKLLIC